MQLKRESGQTPKPWCASRAWCAEDGDGDSHRWRFLPLALQWEGDVRWPGRVRRLGHEWPHAHATCSTECLSQGATTRKFGEGWRHGYGLCIRLAGKSTASGKRHVCRLFRQCLGPKPRTDCQVE
uniref:Uncharacterized protein n=1 Tax=Leersia perrieri TaxID=77586 RepID=A0A0D9VIL2_9ORYZ